MGEVDSRYQAPQSVVADLDAPAYIEPAGKWRRFFNFLIDYVCFVLLAAVVGVIVGMVGGPSAVQAMERLPDLAIGASIWLLYYVPMEALFGRTIGKFVTRTRVVTEDGHPPSFGRVLGRTVARWIPFEPLSMLFQKDQAWHDSLTKTFVIYAP